MKPEKLLKKVLKHTKLCDFCFPMYVGANLRKWTLNKKALFAALNAPPEQGLIRHRLYDEPCCWAHPRCIEMWDAIVAS